MDSTIEATEPTSSWNVEPTNIVSWILFIALFGYLFFRHFVFVMLLLELFMSALREFGWYPKPGNRTKAVKDWLIAVGLFATYLLIGGAIGWIDFVPQQID
jgi:hypothetical protein